jgi:hypothetical protein
VDRSTAVDQLPEAYAAALRLQDEGHDDQAIAVRLGLAPAAVTFSQQLSRDHLVFE